MFVSYLFLLLYFFFTSFLVSSQQNITPPLIFSPTANPTYHYSPHLLNEVSPTITCTATSLSYVIATTIWNYVAPWAETIKNALTKDNYELLKTIIQAFLWKYKYIIAGNTLIGSYVATSIILVSDYHFMTDNLRWSQWKQEHSFEDLCSISHQELTKELLITINQRNYNNNKPTDINHPLITFISDINHEIYRINRYISIASMQKRLCLIKLFPTSEAKIKKAEQLLTRAHFIKHLFLSWLSEYNVNNEYRATV